jgi:molybdopterin-binding protein
MEGLSARNRLTGVVRSVTLGTIMAEVIVDVAEQEIVAVITRGAAERLSLQEGENVTVVVKATEVMIAIGT